MDDHGHRLRSFRHSTVGYNYLLTVVAAKRQRLFATSDSAFVVASSLAYFHSQRLIFGYAWVVMPDHVHWALQLRERRLATIMLRMKNWTARELNRMHRQPGRRVWQRGYHDVSLHEPGALPKSIEYIRMNPVKAGLCDEPEHYPWLWVGDIEPDWDGWLAP